METILAALGANAIVLGALAYLLKTIIGTQLQKEVLEFKNAIERKASEEIEQFRSQLEKDRLRMQISYGGIFERQANAIIELYGAIISLERSVSEAIHSGGKAQARRDKFEQSLWELRRTIIEKQILLPPDVDAVMGEFLAKLPRAVRTYISTETRDLSRLSSQEMDKIFERQDKALEIIEKEVPELRTKLVAEMRRVIGVIASEF
jgi:hypothetical protein